MGGSRICIISQTDVRLFVSLGGEMTEWLKVAAC